MSFAGVRLWKPASDQMGLVKPGKAVETDQLMGFAGLQVCFPSLRPTIRYFSIGWNKRPVHDE